MSKKIKVSGYTRKEQHLGDISYRPFNPIAKPLRKDAVFTSGNFSIVSNVDNKEFKDYVSTPFSKYYSLNDLGLVSDEVSEIFIKDRLSLNFDPSNLKNYAYFGSLKEYMRTTLEKIISTFPAAIVIRPYYIDSNGNIAYTNYSEASKYLTFKINQLENPYGIKLSKEQPTPELDIRDFTINFDSFVLSDGINDIEIEKYVIDDTDLKIYSNGKLNILKLSKTLYIKPKEKEFEKFYNNLNELGKELLNREVSPRYTYKFKQKEFVPELGYYVEGYTNGTWPCSDGYNIDFNNSSYIEYVSDLIELCDKHDEESSNIVIRQMISTSILEFDTLPSLDHDNNINYGQKIKTLLSIYGRSFDESKKYIDGLKYANTVTYDNKDNTPDDVISSIANTLGWGLFNINDIFDVNKTFLEKGVGKSGDLDYKLTKEEAKKEIFKRLIINSPWFYKAKGTRKVIDFFAKFLRIPRGLMDFREHVYLAKNKLDYQEIFDTYYSLHDDDIRTQNLFVSTEGYPVIPENSDEDYFQMAGRWHQETTGVNSFYEVNDGNNPHIGPYDGGKSYLNKYKNLIPDFKPVNYIKSTIKEKTNNIFNETFSSYPIGVLTHLVDTISQTKFTINGYIEYPLPSKILTNNCGCDYVSTEKTMKIGAKTNPSIFNCNYQIMNVGTDSILRFYNGSSEVTVTPECCNGLGGRVEFSYKYNKNVCTLIDLVECERYVYQSINSNGLQVFLDQKTGSTTNVVPMAECCKNGAQPKATEGGYLCNLGTSILGKCIKIDSIVVNHSLSPRPDLVILYTKASTNRKTSFRIPTASNGTLSTDVILRSTTTDVMTIGLEDQTAQQVTVQNLIDNSGSVVISNTGHSMTLTTSTGITKINYSYVDCPALNYDDICLKFIDMELINNSVPTNTVQMYYTKSVDKTRMYMNKTFTGNTLSIENEISMITTFDSTIDLNLIQNGVTTSKVIDIKSNLDYSTINIGTIVYMSVLLSNGVTVKYKIRPIACVSCPNIDPVSEVIIDKKHYIQFSVLGTSDIITDVPSAECCPSYTFPEVSGSAYKCFTGEYEVDDNCTEVEGQKILDRTGTIGTTVKNPPEFDKGIVALTMGSYGTKITIPETGRYKFFNMGYAVGRFYNNDSSTSNWNGDLWADIYVKKSGQSNYVVTGDYITFDYFSGDSAPAANPNYTRTMYQNYNAGDILMFGYNTNGSMPGDTYSGTLSGNDCVFTITKVDEICGCAGKIVGKSYAYNPVNREGSNYEGKANASIKVTNGSDVKEFTVDITTPGVTSQTFSGFNIKSDSIISFTNFLEVTSAPYFGSTSNGVYTCTGLEVMTSLEKIIRVAYKNTSNRIIVIDWEFTASDCSGFPTLPYRITPDINNYYLFGTEKWLHPSQLSFKFEVSAASEIYVNVSGFASHQTGSNINFNSTTPTQIYLIKDGVVSSTPDEWGFISIMDNSSLNCNGAPTDIENLVIDCLIKLPVGTHSMSVDGSPGSTYCTSNHNQAFMSCGLSRDDVSANASTYMTVNFNILKSMNGGVKYYKSMSSIDFCQTE